jgi:hypothetical protein
MIKKLKIYGRTIDNYSNKTIDEKNHSFSDCKNNFVLVEVLAPILSQMQSSYRMLAVYYLRRKRLPLFYSS